MLNHLAKIPLKTADLHPHLIYAPIYTPLTDGGGGVNVGQIGWLEN